MAKDEGELGNPLTEAISQRDRDVMIMVRNALARRQVMLAWQPVIASGQPDRIAFWEGLLRVADSTGRIIPAREFVPVIETQEMGRVLDCLALEQALAALDAVEDLRVSVNMSARSIGYPRWRETLARGLKGRDDIAERLILEITESSAMLMPDTVTVFMSDYQHRGVAFALDDFGAGYTAFRYLRDFYFDIIKIDGQFVRGIARSPDNQVLAGALIAIARHFEMFTVAEYVENADDATYLIDNGIDCLQGHFFGVPTLQPPWLKRDGARMAG